MNKTKKDPYKTNIIHKQERLKEAEDSVLNLKMFIKNIIQDKSESLIKPLSVELRKLLSPYGSGNDLLFRLEQDFNIKWIFPDRSKTLPRSTKYVGLSEFRNRIIFAIGGRPITRLNLINMVANQKGAHTDDVVDQMHSISQQVILPLGNPARDQLLFTQNTTYLLMISKTVVEVIGKQLTKSKSIL